MAKRDALSSTERLLDLIRDDSKPEYSAPSVTSRKSFGQRFKNMFNNPVSFKKAISVGVDLGHDDLKLVKRGKVRDIYDLGDTLLMVVTDRISAFDVVMPDQLPDKGIILTQISLFWFDIMKSIVPNHVITADVDEFVVQPGKLSADVLTGWFRLVRAHNV